MDNQSLMVGQLGLTSTHFDRPAPVLTDTSAGPRGDQGPEFSKWSSGVILGLGYQSSITNNLSVRGLYSHHYHERIRLPEYSTSGQVSKYYDWIMQSSHMAISVNYLIY